MTHRKQGKIYLVGAGPGDPELLTLKAHRLLREVRLILHDDLVPPEILALAGPQAKLVNVGKRCGTKRITQAEINAQMIAAARKGTDVVRLKSGDPTIFGRLGEELDALADADVSYEIIAGITAGIAAAAALGMSLTDRRSASRLLIASAHHAPEKSDDGMPRKQDWSGVTDDTTLMIYMPGHGIAALRDELLKAGLASDMPAIVVSNASTLRQRHHQTTLAEIASGPHLEAPSVLLIGRALALRSSAAKTEISLLIEQSESILAGK